MRKAAADLTTAAPPGVAVNFQNGSATDIDEITLMENQARQSNSTGELAELSASKAALEE